MLKKLLADDKVRQEVALDLAQSTTQTTHTTKLDRRQKALAYLLDNLTGAWRCEDEFTLFPSEEWCVEVSGLCERLHAVATSAEVKVACERSIKRLRDALIYARWGRKTCVACGERYEGGDHACTGRAAKCRDARMAHDPTLGDFPQEK